MSTEAAKECRAFTYAIRRDRKGFGHVAFINWRNEEGETVLAGILNGFSDPEFLRRAADACVAALNGQIGFWEEICEKT